MEKGERRTGIDLIKVLAVVSVISIHTIGNLHVLDMDMCGIRAFLIVVFRYLVMECVPLFLMITGFYRRAKHQIKSFIWVLCLLRQAIVLSPRSVPCTICILILLLRGRSPC